MPPSRQTAIRPGRCHDCSDISGRGRSGFLRAEVGRLVVDQQCTWGLEDVHDVNMGPKMLDGVFLAVVALEVSLALQLFRIKQTV